MALGYSPQSPGGTAMSTWANGINKQTIMVFADTTERDSDLSGLEEDGMFCTVQDTNWEYRHDGSNWQPYSSPPTSFVPSWTNASMSASTAHYWYSCGKLHIGLRSTVSAVTGTFYLTLPNSETAAAYAVGTCRYLDNGTRNYPGSCQVDSGATSVNMFHSESTSAGAVTASAPFTWASGDYIYLSIEVAV